MSVTFFCKQNQRGAQIFLICLLLFSTCFGQLCAHHEKIPYLCDALYLSLYIDDGLVCRAYQVGSIYKRLYKDAWSTKHKILSVTVFYLRNIYYTIGTPAASQLHLTSDYEWKWVMPITRKKPGNREQLSHVTPEMNQGKLNHCHNSDCMTLVPLSAAITLFFCTSDMQCGLLLGL